MEIPCYNIIMSTKDNINIFSQNLRMLREEKGYTQTKLAELSGVSQRAIAHYEKYAKRPSIDKVKKLAQVLGVTDEELLGLSPRTKKDEDLSYKIMKKVRIIEELPTRDQNAIFQFINTIVEKNKLKKELSEKEENKKSSKKKKN